MSEHFPDTPLLSGEQKFKLIELLIERGVDVKVAELVVLQNMSINEAKKKLGK